MISIDEAIQDAASEIFKLFRRKPGPMIVCLPINIYRDMLKGRMKFPDGYVVKPYGRRRPWPPRSYHSRPRSMGRRGNLYHRRHAI